ncbi:MAG: hypothetical protein E4H02_07495 [Lentisphaerales bacterium]|nr:MAG: hypothetical protein E4H02_07495 [Lentisphaerales bacterium]
MKKTGLLRVGMCLMLLPLAAGCGKKKSQSQSAGPESANRAIRPVPIMQQQTAIPPPPEPDYTRLEKVTRKRYESALSNSIGTRPARTITTVLQIEDGTITGYTVDGLPKEDETIVGMKVARAGGLATEFVQWTSLTRMTYWWEHRLAGRPTRKWFKARLRPVPGLRWWWEEEASEDGKVYQVVEMRRFDTLAVARPGETVSCVRSEIWKDTGFPKSRVFVDYVIEGADGDVDKIDTGISLDQLIASGKATRVTKMEYSCEVK